MWKTAILLIVTLIVIPLSSYYFDKPLGDDQLSCLKQLIIVALCIAGICFLMGELSGNNSQVDKLWSIIPIYYVARVYIESGFDLRIGIMTLLTLIWCIRLTYNFSRRGAYHWIPWQGEEDYRWKILRQKPGLNKPWNWRLFNLFFICIYQNLLILAFTLPTIVAWQSNAPLNYLDYIAAFSMLSFIITETIADQQQYNFHSDRKKLQVENQPLPQIYQDGFVKSGLWSKVRHPNYASEQAIWICFYLFSVAATGRWCNWSAVGALLLLLLFQGSSDFSESISSSKYPEYKNYQKTTPRFIPRLW